MRIVISVLLLSLTFFTLIGCNQHETSRVSRVEVIGNPQAEDILVNNPEADIFQFNEIVYSNAVNLEWVQAANLTKGELVGIIKEQYMEGKQFKDEMATILPVGAEIYEPVNRQGPILIVIFEDKEWRYLGLIEG